MPTLPISDHLALTSERWLKRGDSYYANICNHHVSITKRKDGYSFSWLDSKPTFKYLDTAKFHIIQAVRNYSSLQDRIISHYLSKLTHKQVEVYRKHIAPLKPFALLKADLDRSGIKTLDTLQMFESEGFITYTDVGDSVQVQPLSCLPYSVLLVGVSLTHLHNLKNDLSVGDSLKRDETSLKGVLTSLGEVNFYNCFATYKIPQDILEAVIKDFSYYSPTHTPNYLP